MSDGFQNIPKDWSAEALGSVMNNIIDFRGKTPLKIGMNWGGGDIPALSANNVEMGRINFRKECYLGSEALYSKWMNNGDCAKNDVVMTMEAPLGNVALIPDNKKYILSQRVILMKPDIKKLTGDYLFHFLQCESFQRMMDEESTGTTAKGIQRKKLEKLLIVRPNSIEEQLKIAQIITAIDEQIKVTENLIEKKKLIKIGLVDEAVRLATSSGVYEVMSDYCQSVADGTHDTPAPLEAGVPLLTSKNLSENGNLDLSDFYYISEKQSLEINKRSYVNQGDLLFGMIGTIGNPVICRDSFDFSVKNVAILRQGGNFLRSKWLFYALNSSLLKRNIGSMLDGSTQKFLSLTKVRGLSIPILEKSEMSSWVNTLDAIHEEILIEGKFLEKLKTEKQGLMQDLLTGRVRVN